MHDFLDTEPLSLDLAPSVREGVHQLKRHIAGYRNSLNAEGIWLLLAAIGCWGVPQKAFQTTAFVITGILFVVRVQGMNATGKSFYKLADALETRVRAEVSEPELRAGLLLELQQMRVSTLTVWRTLRASYAFLFGWVFWGASFLYVLAA